MAKIARFAPHAARRQALSLWLARVLCLARFVAFEAL